MAIGPRRMRVKVELGDNLPYSGLFPRRYPMSLREQLNADLKDAMKSGDKRKVATLRLVNSAIKDKDINSRTEGHDSNVTADPGIIDLLAKMVKQRQDSVAAFEQGGRPELAQAERE